MFKLKPHHFQSFTKVLFASGVSHCFSEFIPNIIKSKQNVALFIHIYIIRTIRLNTHMSKSSIWSFRECTGFKGGLDFALRIRWTVDADMSQRCAVRSSGLESGIDKFSVFLFCIPNVVDMSYNFSGTRVVLTRVPFFQRPWLQNECNLDQKRTELT